MSKKILYLAENAISPIQGGGIVVYALLRGLEAEKLFGFYTYASITPAQEYRARLFRLPDLFSLRKPSDKLPPFCPNLHPPSSKKFSLKNRLKRFSVFTMAYAIDRITGCDFKYALKQVEAEGFIPEMIFLAGLSLRMLRLGRLFAEHFDVKVVMLNMDDWMAEETFNMRPLSKYWAKSIKSEMRKIAPRIAKAITNSPHLADQCTRRYAIEHSPVNNACYDLLRGGLFIPRVTIPREQPIVITFSGALNWFLQGESLVLFAYAVAELALSEPVVLHIYTPWEFSPIANAVAIPGKVIYKGFLNKDNLVQAYLDSDFLVASTTFRDDEIHLFRYSLATKVSDYLSVGRPIISIGHADWAVHDYVETHGCGVSITTNEISCIKEQLAKTLSLPVEKREEIGRRNRDLWKTAHDIRVMGRTARECLGLGEVPSQL